MNFNHLKSTCNQTRKSLGHSCRNYRTRNLYVPHLLIDAIRLRHEIIYNYTHTPENLRDSGVLNAPSYLGIKMYDIPKTELLSALTTGFVIKVMNIVQMDRKLWPMSPSQALLDSVD